MDISPDISSLSLNNHFYKVFKNIIDKKSKNESIVNEIEWINNQLISENRKICENACIVLVQYGLKYDFGMSLNTFILAFGRLNNDNFDLLANGMMNLLFQNMSECLNFQITEKPHPATILLKETNVSKMTYLSIKINETFTNSDCFLKENAAKFWYPILLSAVCNNEVIHSELNEIWRTIVESENQELIGEIISMRRVTSPTSCMFFNSMIVLLLHKSFDPDHELGKLLLLLSSTKRMVEYSLDITTNIDTFKRNIHIIESNMNSLNIILFIFAEILQNCSIKYVPKIVEVLNLLIIKTSFDQPVILHMILDGLIQALAYPSFMSTEMEPIEKLLNYIRSSNFLKKSPGKIIDSTKLQIKALHFDKILSNARDLCIFLESRQSYQYNLVTLDHEKLFWERNHLVLRGLFQTFHLGHMSFEQWKIVLINLIEISKAKSEVRSSLVMPLLFRLAENFEPRVKVTILQNLVELGASNEIFNTIKALSTGMIRSMSIDLFLRLWKIEPRIYPFLHKVLVEKSELDKEDIHLEIVRAAAIREICDLKPHNGSDLVSLISQILTESLESRDAEISAALALDAISLLCQNHIISITSTWKAINLSTRYEKRNRVIKSLCNFFSIVPQFKRNNQEFENFNKEIINRLFYMIEWSEPFGIHCALNALKSWRYDTFTLDMIPDVYRENISLPQAVPRMEVSILDLEVPGECYVQLLMKINPNARKSVGELISHYIKQEIAEYRSGNYIVKEGQPEPINYKNLPKQSIVKALVHFIMRQATTKKAENVVDEAIIFEALNVLTQRYSRPLPPLNWNFLGEIIKKWPTMKPKCIAIAAKQAVISGSAKLLIESFLINNEIICEEDVEIALDNLIDLCNVVSNDIFKQFYEKVCTCAHVKHQEKIFDLLNHEKVVTNRENLAMIISTFINRHSSDICKIINIVEAIPSNVLNMIHLKSREKIRYRCEILKDCSRVENPVLWLNELIIDQLNRNECRELMISSIEDLLIKSKNFPKKKWLNELIILTQNRMVEKNFLDEDLQYLLDVFVIGIITLSGYFLLKTSDASRYQLFAQSMELISHSRLNDDIIGSIFEFILYVLSHETISANIKQIFMIAIILSKDHKYFKKLSTWQKALQAMITTKYNCTKSIFYDNE